MRFISKVWLQRENSEASVWQEIMPTVRAGGCGLFFLASVLLSLGLGSSEVGFSELGSWIAFLLGGTPTTFIEANAGWIGQVFWDIRLPRTCVAALCGAALAVAGVISQGLFRNSLASPDVLGTSSGAALAAVVSIHFGLGTWSVLAWFALPLAASSGALVASGLLLCLHRQKAFAGLEQLLLAGFALSSFLGALTSLVLSLSLEDREKTASTLHWLLGGFSARSWEHVYLGVGPVCLGIYLAFKLAPSLDLLVLGQEVAASLGLNLRKFRQQALLIVCILVGSSVCMAGSLPFIGLIVPHLSRLLLGPRHRPLLFFSVLNGMALTLIADLIARTVRAPLEMEVGVFTAMLGAPFFLLILGKQAHGHTT